MSLSEALTELVEDVAPPWRYSCRVVMRIFSSIALFSSVIPVSAPISSRSLLEGRERGRERRREGEVEGGRGGEKEGGGGERGRRENRDNAIYHYNYRIRKLK